MFISGFFSAVFLILGVLGYLIPERKYLPPSRFTEEEVNPPTFRKYIIVKKEGKARYDIRPVNYQPDVDETIVTDEYGTIQVFSPHIFGTDVFGRDIALRTLVATRSYLFPSFISIVLSLVLGSLLGILSSDLLNRSFSKIFPQAIMDTLEALPKYVTILLAIILIPVEARDFKVGIIHWHCFYWLAMILGLLNAPKIGKIVEGRINALEKREFIESAISMGLSKFRIAIKHVLWHNCMPSIIAQMTSIITEVILIEVTLSYLGDISKIWGLDVTVDMPYPSWGNMLIMGKTGFLADKWWLSVFPLLFVIIFVSNITLFGQSVNRALIQRRILTSVIS